MQDAAIQKVEDDSLHEQFHKSFSILVRKKEEENGRDGGRIYIGANVKTTRVDGTIPSTKFES